MKSTCPKCKTVLEINEKDYEPGVTVEKECPLCGEYIAFDIPEEVVAPKPTPSVDDQRIASLERQLAIMKEQHQNKVEELEEKVREQQHKIEQTPATPVMPSMAYTSTSSGRTYVSSRSKTTAGILAIFLGGLGIHKFYLGQTGMGILYFIFCWTYVASIVGFIEGIMYLVMSDDEFNEKYNTY